MVYSLQVLLQVYPRNTVGYVGIFFKPEFLNPLELQETQHVTFIDLGGMGNKTDKTDVQRLSQALKPTAIFSAKSGEIWNMMGGGGLGDAGINY